MQCALLGKLFFNTYPLDIQVQVYILMVFFLNILYTFRRLSALYILLAGGQRYYALLGATGKYMHSWRLADQYYTFGICWR